MATSLSEGVKGFGIPENVTAFLATNATACAAAATPQSIKAAISGKKHWVTKAVFSNITASEIAKLNLTDGTTHKAKCVLNGPGSFEMTFDPPLEITAGAAITLDADDDVGDSYCTISGYVEN